MTLAVAAPANRDPGQSGPPRLVTPEELLRLPDNASLELVDGRIVEKKVSIESSAIEGRIAHLFMTHCDAQPGALVFPSSLGYRVFADTPEKIRKPDVTVILKTRLTSTTGLDSGYMTIVPDLAVEVISPHDTVYDVELKVQEYQAAGFPLLWLVYPRSRTVTVCPLDGKPLIFTETDTLDARNALPGFVCKVSDFFPPR